MDFMMFQLFPPVATIPVPFNLMDIFNAGEQVKHPQNVPLSVKEIVVNQIQIYEIQIIREER